jgi:hypothetical protein
MIELPWKMQAARSGPADTLYLLRLWTTILLRILLHTPRMVTAWIAQVVIVVRECYAGVGSWMKFYRANNALFVVCDL